jgi:hypothetical protein
MNKLIINQAAARTITIGASATQASHTRRHIIINLKDYENKFKLN